MDLYAKRARVERDPCKPDGPEMLEFCEGFEHQPTTDQVSHIRFFSCLNKSWYLLLLVCPACRAYLSFCRLSVCVRVGLGWLSPGLRFLCVFAGVAGLAGLPVSASPCRPPWLLVWLLGGAQKMNDMPSWLMYALNSACDLDCCCRGEKSKNSLPELIEKSVTVSYALWFFV